MRQLKKSVTRINNGLARCRPRLSGDVMTFTSSLFASAGGFVLSVDGIGAKRQSRKRKALPNMRIANDAQINDKVEREMIFF